MRIDDLVRRHWDRSQRPRRHDGVPGGGPRCLWRDGSFTRPSAPLSILRLFVSNHWYVRTAAPQCRSHPPWANKSQCVSGLCWQKCAQDPHELRNSKRLVQKCVCAGGQDDLGNMWIKRQDEDGHGCALFAKRADEAQSIRDRHQITGGNQIGLLVLVCGQRIGAVGRHDDRDRQCSLRTSKAACKVAAYWWSQAHCWYTMCMLP
jgi:hypothetical protein